MILKNEDILNYMGKKIKEARLAKKYTQDITAEKADISTDLLRNIENGRNMGSLLTVLNICNALETTPNDIFEDLLVNKNKVLDKKLYSEFQELTINEKGLIRTLMTYVKKNRE